MRWEPATYSDDEKSMKGEVSRNADAMAAPIASIQSRSMMAMLLKDLLGPGVL